MNPEKCWVRERGRAGEGAQQPQLCKEPASSCVWWGTQWRKTKGAGVYGEMCVCHIQLFVSSFLELLDVVCPLISHPQRPW